MIGMILTDPMTSSIYNKVLNLVVMCIYTHIHTFKYINKIHVS